jgi:hypothetical protein
MVGGDKALAGRLGIGETALSKFMSDSWELPDALLLLVMDIILADRELRGSLLSSQPAAQSPQESIRASQADR